MEDLLVDGLLVLRGADGQHLAYGRTANNRWLFVVLQEGLADRESTAAMRRRVTGRAKRPVTLRLERKQIDAAKQAAQRMGIPY